MTEGRVHPDCRNASNPYHKCVEYCFLKIAELKERMEQLESDVKQGRTTDGPSSDYDQAEYHHVQESGRDEHDNGDDDDSDDEYHHVQESGRDEHDNGDDDDSDDEVDNTQLTEWKRKLFKLKVKAAYQSANVADILEASSESRLDTPEAAKNKYKKCEKKPAPFGWESWDEPESNQKTLYDADKKLKKNIECNVGEYNKMKEADPEFYGDASSSLQYGKAQKISEDKICKMVKELHDKDEEDMIYKMVKELLEKDEKRKAFSRRRKFHDEKDIDSINDHNENFNKIIERAYDKYTQEIKNNLERGNAALQGCVGAGLFTFCIGVAVLNSIWVSIR